RQQLEKIIFFFNSFRRPSALRTRLPRPNFHVHLVKHAILPGVAIFIYVPVVANLLPKFLHSTFVALRRGPDVVVIRNSHPVPKRAEFSGNFVSERLWRFARSLSSPLDLLPVLVRPRKKPRIAAQHPLPPRDRITRDRRVSVPNMRSRIHVINRCRNVELFRHFSDRARIAILH